MANKFAVANGNFNATSTWSDTPAGLPGASVPVAGDNAYANSKTVAITANATCTKISTEAENGATGTGGFTLSAGVTLTANVTSGGTTCLTAPYASPNSSTVTGNVNGGTSATAYGILISGTGTLNISGNITGGTATNSIGVYISAACTLNTSNGNVSSGPYPGAAAGAGMSINAAASVNIVGNVTSPNNVGIATGNYAVTLNITGTVTGCPNGATYGINLNNALGSTTITGNVYGGAGGNGWGIYNLGAAPITIIGNVYAGSGVSAHGINDRGSPGTLTVTGNVYGVDTSTGGSGISFDGANRTVNIIGSVLAGKYGIALINGSTAGNAKVVRAVGNGYGINTVGISSTAYGLYANVQNALNYVEEIQFGTLGQPATFGPVYLTDKSTNVAIFTKSSGVYKTLSDANNVSGAIPSASDVRYGVYYNYSGNMGTCRVPAASSVGYGVLVDNTTGTAVLTPDIIWNTLTSTLTTSGSIGERLKNASTIASTSQQIADAISA